MLQDKEKDKYESYDTFREYYFSTFLNILIFLSLFGQLLWVLKDIVVDGVRGNSILLSIIFRNMSVLLMPAYTISYKRNRYLSWQATFIAVWISIISNVLYNVFVLDHSANYTGEGYLIYFILFFAISIVASKQWPLYLSYAAFPLLIMHTSTMFGGPIEYNTSILWTMIVGISMSVGFIVISKLIRIMLKKLYINEVSLMNLSEIDQLTGCYNRHKLDAITDNNYSLRRESTIFIIDIDHLKQINDKQGHLVGDEAIKYVAHCLKDSIRLGDLAIRYGGDEFVIIFTGFVKEFDVYTRILEQMEIDNKYNITLSIGTTRVTNDNLDLKQAIKRADIAAYQSKIVRNKMTIFEEMSMPDEPFSAEKIVEDVI